MVTLRNRALLADTGLVLVFVLVGRRSHDEGSALLGIVRTAWPFLVGLAVGWWAVRGRPVRLAPEGIIVWASTVAVGMLLRAVSSQGTAFSFIVVATLVLGAFLLGWRALLPRLTRRRAASTR